MNGLENALLTLADQLAEATAKARRYEAGLRDIAASPTGWDADPTAGVRHVYRARAALGMLPEGSATTTEEGDAG